MDIQRLLDPALLPASLWDEKDKMLRLPPALAKAYQTVIDHHHLRALAEARDPKNPPVGGLTQPLTDKHFAQAFDGSVARTQLALLDPKSEVTQASNAFIGSLAVSRLSLTDAPCGAGAAAFAFLTNVAELRACNVLPRLPLYVFLIGAELSVPARTYAAEMLDELRASLEEQAIFIEAEFLSWDVTDSLSNTDLIRRMTLVSADYPMRLLTIANFNGFLEKEGKRKAAGPQLDELFRYASGPQSVAIWIEPNMNPVTVNGGLFTWLKSKLEGAWRRFIRAPQFSTSSAMFSLPLNPAKAARVTLSVMPLDLGRST